MMDTGTNKESRNSSHLTSPLIHLGNRLRSARENQGFDVREMAGQLRLNANVISHLEKGAYPSDVPELFIRGYLRSYGKLLGIPEEEILKAINPPTAELNDDQNNLPPRQTSTVKAEAQKKPSKADKDETKLYQYGAVSRYDYLMHMFTFVILFTMIGLIALWWHSYTPPEERQRFAHHNTTQPTSQLPIANPTTIDKTAPNDNHPRVVAQTATNPAIRSHAFSATDANVAASLEAIVAKDIEDENKWQASAAEQEDEATTDEEDGYSNHQDDSNNEDVSTNTAD